MKIFLILFILLFSFLPLQAQVSAAFDTSRMERDLDIMTMVLDRLVFNTSGAFTRFGGSTKGIYLPDYGVIFLMPNAVNSALTIYSVTSQVRRFEEEMAQQRRSKSASRAKAGEGSGMSYEYRAENKQDVKTPLVEFFFKYADAIDQLDDSERIAVYRSGGIGNVFYSLSVAGQAVSRSSVESGGEDLLAVARKADIAAFRSGRLKAEDFKSRLIFKNIEAAAANSEIDIMARIIDTALQGRTREQTFNVSHSRGIYLDDFGAIFFTNATFGPEAHINIWQTVEEQRVLEEGLQKRVLDLQRASAQRRENWAVQYKKFKQQLSEVIADYGHTLRQLQPQDNIVITADLDHAPEEGPSYLICRVKKQQVEAFNARRISREQLLKMISYTEY